jgi:hypothetical protein
VMTLSRQLGRGMMLMLSHADDGAAEATWPWTRSYCQVMPMTTLPRKLSRDAMVMPSHTGDIACTYKRNMLMYEATIRK